MGIKFLCPNGHKLNVKSFLAGKRGICPHCGISVDIPEESTLASKKNGRAANTAKSAGEKALSAPAGAATLAATAASPAAKSVAVAPVPAAVPAQATVNLQNTRATPAALAAPMAPAMPTPAPVPQAAPTPPRNVATPIGMPAQVLAHAAVATPVPAPVATVAALPPDPIAEAPNSVWYVRPPSGGQFGPAKGDIMRKWIAEGRVSADSLVWREGWPDWKTAGPIFPTLARTPPAAPAAPAAAAMPANPLSQPLASSSVAKPRGAAPKSSNALSVAVVVLLGLISVILSAVFAYVVINGNLLNGRKKNDTSQTYLLPDLDNGHLVHRARDGGSHLGRG